MKDKKYIITIGIIGFLFFVFSVVVGLTVGLLENPDAYFYVILGQFMTKGIIMPVFPFNATRPQTLYGPVYGMLITTLLDFPSPWQMTTIVVVQMFFTALSALIVGYFAKIFFGKKYSIPTALLFLALPFVLEFTTTIMSEATTTLLVTTSLLFFVLAVKKKSVFIAGLLVFTVSLLSLTKYVFQFFIPLAFLTFGILFIQKIRKKKDLRISFSFIPVILGIVLLFGWMSVVHKYYGVWTLSIDGPVPAYRAILHHGKVLPPPGSVGYETIAKRLGPDIAKPDWDVVNAFTPEFNAGLVTEKQVMEYMQRAIIDAISAHPAQFAAFLVRNTWDTLMTPPYHHNMLTQLGFPEDCPECRIHPPCRYTWNKNLCLPFIDSPVARTLWANLIYFHKSWYPPVMAPFFVLVVFGSLAAIIKRNFLLVSFAFVFFFVLEIHAGATVPDGRYVLMMYPPYTILLVYGAKTVLFPFLKLCYNSIRFPSFLRRG